MKNINFVIFSSLMASCLWDAFDSGAISMKETDITVNYNCSRIKMGIPALEENFTKEFATKDTYTR